MRSKEIMKKQLLGKLRKYLFPIPGMIEGDGCRFLGKPRINIHPEAHIVLENCVVLNSEPRGYHAGMTFPVTLIADRSGAEIIIGENSRLHGCCIHAWSSIKLGRKCLLAAGSQILDANGHVTELRYARLRQILQDKPDSIVLGDYCWLGLGAIVLKGVNLGEGCMVAAYSVVGKGNYPPFSLIAGSPARVIKTIPPEEVLSEEWNADRFSDEAYTINYY